MYRRLCVYAAAAVMGIMAALAVSCAFAVTTVTDSGMEPAIKKGSVVLINKMVCDMERADSVEVGNVVAFKSDVYGEDGEGSILVRRVAGTTGDVVVIRDDIFYLNGKPYQEYMSEAVHMEDMGPVKLGENELFVLSDDRQASMDSRNEAIGILSSGECIGKVCFK